MKVFFDNCLSPALASTLDGFIRHHDWSAHHIAHLPCGRHCADIEWIQYLADEGSDWVVMTGDDRIRKNKAEREAYRAAKLKGFVLAPAFQKMPLHRTASLLLWRWHDMRQLMELVAGPALFDLPIGRSSKIKPLPF